MPNTKKSDDVIKIIKGMKILKGLEVEFNQWRTAFAVFSPGRVHRYLMARKFKTGKGVLIFVMYNPSDAGATRSDPTARRCRSFAKSMGYRGFMIVNLFAGIATDPDELREHDNPRGALNEHFLMSAIDYAKSGKHIICVAWGAFKGAQRPGEVFVEQCREMGVQPYCLGLAKGGAPRHPLYLNGTTELEQYNG